MTHDEIAAFLMVVSCGSISSAAEKLYITQPALSNRLKLLEQDLGYSLIRRRKGSRTLEITDEGYAFIPLARKNEQMWKDARMLPYTLVKNALRVLSIPSVTEYIFPDVIRNYLEEHPDVNFSLSCSHSVDSYRLIENGEADLALVSPELFSARVQAMPAYRSKMVLVTAEEADYPEYVKVSDLEPSQELRITWSPEYDNWHDSHFPSTARPYLLLDDMRVAESMLYGKHWAFIPMIMAERLYISGTCIRSVDSPPPDQRVFCLYRNGEKTPQIRSFLNTMHENISGVPGTVSYLDKEIRIDSTY